MRRRSLVDLVATALVADPLDAPVVYLEADLLADDLERYAPTAEDPWFVPPGWGEETAAS